MIISRMIARRRIAAGARPGWFAAWGAGDGGCGIAGALLYPDLAHSPQL